MSKTLTEIAQQLKDKDKKVQLIYAFNGTGKTRLSRAFKTLLAGDNVGENEPEEPQWKTLYYNAFTEDLFYWDNDLDQDAQRKLKIHPNSFTPWVLGEQGKENDVIGHFQHYSNSSLMPKFHENFSEVSFSFEQGHEHTTEFIKSLRERRALHLECLYTLLEQVISERNILDAENRTTRQFDELEYVFIDDPVSSLDENHLIELAVSLAKLISESEHDNGLRFIISTHNPLFYNVLWNELKRKACYMLSKFEDGTFELEEKQGDSNTSFSYHLFLKQTIEQAIQTPQSIQKYHFTLLRNLYEKTASFLGYRTWSELLPDDQEAYLNRIIQFTSHSTLRGGGC
ncbi:anticodon nuclease [Vibrio astriarenae]|nr:anticodon nuclease [Vibrio sp. C7]